MKFHLIIKFVLEVGLERFREGGIDGVILEKIASLPFVPNAGNMLAITKGEDYRRVEEVYWSFTEGMTVHFEYGGELSDEQLEALKKLDWREAK